MARMKSEFYRERVSAKLMKVLEPRLLKIMKRLRDYMRKLISRPNPTGMSPSKAGEPPKMVTGELKKSIRIAFSKQRGKISGQLLIDALYGSYLEFGTSKMDPRPFVRPTMQANKQHVVKWFKTE